MCKKVICQILAAMTNKCIGMQP